MKEIFKKIAPDFLVVAFRRVALRLNNSFMLICGKSNRLSGFYYLLFGGFSREQRSVLQGRQAYYESLYNISETCALLRRNIHRIEKGLIMRPRRDVFAEGFILETVKTFRNALSSGNIDANERKWAADVLDEYFNIVEPTRTISKAKEKYFGSRHNGETYYHEQDFPSADGKYRPYKYSEIQRSNITFDELKTLYIQRRSVRWYADKAVPLEMVRKAANIASFAPSACNRQSYRFLFCNNKEMATQISSCAGGAAGFAENIPAIIAIIGDLSAYPFDRDRHLIYIDGSLAAMQLMLALETLGISSCSINWPEVEANERKIRGIISLKDYERVIMLLAVGYADDSGGIPYSQKKINTSILVDISV